MKIPNKDNSERDPWPLPLRLEPAGETEKNGKTYRLLEPFCYNGRNMIHMVATGTLTDGASIPRLLWPILGHPITHTNLKVGVIHDDGYHRQELSRKVCDSIFYYSILDCMPPRDAKGLAGVVKIALWEAKAWTMWLGVRNWGWIPWRHRKRELNRKWKIEKKSLKS